MLLLFSLLLITITVPNISQGYVPLSQHSLLPPFDDYKSHNGKREINHWDFGGHSKVKRNFIRVTEDKQSKRGWAFNTEALTQRDFALQFKFRISGTGKHLYGDGMGIWLTSHKDEGNPYISEGSLLGHSDTFVGFGIMFDTFRNIEHGHVHKDISIAISNDATKEVTMDGDRPGCESHYRYNEKRDDFDVESHSVARIWLENDKLSLEVDKYGKGEFKKCFDVDLRDYNLPRDWRDASHLSITSSTGALADNHDVLELKVVEPHKFEHMLRVDEEEKDQPLVQVDTNDKSLTSHEVGEHVNDLAYELQDMDKIVNKLQHKVEHDIESVRINLEKIIHKLEDREKDSEGRIDDLEKARENSMNEKLEKRVRTLEDEMNDRFEKRLQVLEKNMGIKIEQSVEKSGGGSGWKIPFMIIICILVLYGFYTYRSLNKLHRRDKLF